MDSHFWVSLEMLNRVKVGALAGPLLDIDKVFPKPHLCCLGCVLRTVVMLWAFMYFAVKRHSAIKPRSIEGCSDVCPSGTLSHLDTGSLDLSQSDHWVLGHLT